VVCPDGMSYVVCCAGLFSLLNDLVPIGIDNGAFGCTIRERSSGLAGVLACWAYPLNEDHR
jgi:hypothetical protein